ncbi:MAG TPA: serine hydrolase domain-containing protein [Frankiaceae bacterium]|jgi:CubicO group peptidase (beta-lactamase class C family)|nr:serine hydrolase domain-containing protein [Frankiaceae bacterium]
MTDRAIDPQAAEQLRQRALRSVESGDVPACQIAIAYRGEVVLHETYGAPAGSRYIIFSATKPVVASVVWMLLTEGALELDRPVAQDIPEFATNGKDVVTLEHVLLHTGGFPSAPMAPTLWNDREGRLRRFCDWRLTFPAGTAFEYHPASGHWVLAELIQRATGRDFREVIRERVLAPLGLNELALGVEPQDAGDVQDVVVSGTKPDPDELERTLGIRELASASDDATLLEFNTDAGRRAGVPGGGGVSNAADMTLFYQALMHDPAGLWDPAMLADVTTVARNRFLDPMTGDPANRSRGLVLKGDDGKGERRHDFGPATSPRTFGHSGVGGQIAWADPQSGLSFCHLTSGLDRDPINQAKRSYALSKRAGSLRAGSA